MSAIIEAKGLEKSFRVRGRNVPVLCRLDFSVSPGQVVVVRGKSGAGKSVLMWLLAGLDRPDGGDIRFEGLSMAGLSNSSLADLRRRRIGVIFQNFNLVASWTALENVAAVLEGDNLSAAEASRRAAVILSEMGLADRLDNLPAELSIGQQQRVAVARTLAVEPALILADEPTGAVDPETAAGIVEMLIGAVKRRGAALVVASHGHFPLDGADLVFDLKDGILVGGR